MVVSIELRQIDRDNWQACCRLSLFEEQQSRGWVASNSYYLAQAAYQPDNFPMGIYLDGVMVGFLIWMLDQRLGGWELCGLMVDRRYQRRGIARRAVMQLMEHLRNRLGSIVLSVCVDPENTAAAALFEALGFVDTGRIEYEERVFQQQLQNLAEQ